MAKKGITSVLKGATIMGSPPQELRESGTVGAGDANLGCPVLMHNKRLCGRPLYNAPAGSDSKPVCLMHSQDRQKSEVEFTGEFNEILKVAKSEAADFTGFVFAPVQVARKVFSAKCVFDRALFRGLVDDETGRPSERAEFGGAEFQQGASFDGAVFEAEVSFTGTKFGGYVDFSNARFLKFACFNTADCKKGVTFFNATFVGEVVFNWAVFAETVNFERAKFQMPVEFRETTFRKDETKKAGLIFSLAEFSDPGAVVFYKTYLGHALFFSCNASELLFSSVEWRRRPRNKKRMVFEEVIDLSHSHPETTWWALRPKQNSSDGRDFRLIEELYQQLKKNYDDRKDYRTAGDFHFGEMEMKRLSSARQLKISRWAHRNLGLVALYRFASHYGESYLRPGCLLLAFVALFALLYPLFGLEYHLPTSQGSEAVRLTFASPFLPGKEDWSHSWKARIKLLQDSAITSLSITSLQKELVHEPSYPMGKVLSLSQLLLTSTLIGLFLLALRRQFQR